MSGHENVFGFRICVSSSYNSNCSVFIFYSSQSYSYLRLKAKWFSCTLINVHAPTNKKNGRVKEEFYNLLEQNINQIANSDIKVMLGDFNAKVGKERLYKPTIDNENLHNETSNNRIRMIQFAISKCFNVRSTIIPHKISTKRHSIQQTVGQRIK